jgi:hypothetical protein
MINLGKVSVETQTSKVAGSETGNPSEAHSI